ncbi:hypothetical protein OBBRIDRAFT_774647 [Obba rivulosa]|uniref:DUF6533 domain-containing protein n=1 Tax=Obba rivulosa TaxID=1052685 RepID=A0A8E2AW94_9APHY|nr:hypothetical protein OBBRIDRAFT_774647 [Obba rivulosa]
MVTLSYEVELIWGRKWSSVTLLFHLNRWTTFIWAVQQLPGPGILPTSCAAYSYFNDAVTLLLFIFWAAFSAVRMYAISGRRMWLALVAFVLNIIPVVTNSYADFAVSWFEIDTLPILGEVCSAGNNISSTVDIAFTISTRISMILADILILLITWAKTYGAYRNAQRNNVEAPLLGLLLKDGTVYFAMLLVLNILIIIANLNDSFVYLVTDFQTPISSIIITHFLLDLRQVVTTSPSDHFDTVYPFFNHSPDDSQIRSWRSRLNFNTSFVDNMGEDISYGVVASSTAPKISLSNNANQHHNEIEKAGEQGGPIGLGSTQTEQDHCGRQEMA